MDAYKPLFMIVIAMVLVWWALLKYTEDPVADYPPIIADNDPRKWQSQWQKQRPVQQEQQIKKPLQDSWVPPLLKAASRSPSLAKDEIILPGLERRDQETLTDYAWRLKLATGSWLSQWRVKDILKQGGHE